MRRMLWLWPSAVILVQRARLRGLCGRPLISELQRARGVSVVRMAIAHDCELPAKVYWALRDDHRYNEYVAAGSDPPNTVELISREETDGVITEIKRVSTLKNPIPYALRGMLGSDSDSQRFPAPKSPPGQGGSSPLGLYGHT